MAATVRPRHTLAGIVVWSLIAAVVFGAGLVAFITKPYSELPLYVLAGSRLRHREQVYRPEERAFTYPALFAIPFVPLSLVPEPLHRPLWYLVNVAALVIIVYRLGRCLQPALPAARARAIGRGWLFWLLVMALSGRHVLSPLENQSHDLLVFLAVMLAIDASCAKREKMAGVMAGLGAALKATPLLWAPLFLWQRRFVAALCLTLTLAALTFLPDVLFPAKDGVSWSVAWYNTFIKSVKPGEAAVARGAWAPGIRNQSLAGTFQRLFTPISHPRPGEPDVSLLRLGPGGLRCLTLAGQLAIAALLAWVTRPRLTGHLPEHRRAFLSLGEGAALVTAMVLLSPTSIKTHFCVLLVPIAFCLADFLYRRRDPFVGTMLIVVFALGTLTVRGILDERPGDYLLGYGSVTWSAVALLLATGRVLLRTSRGDTPSGMEGAPDIREPSNAGLLLTEAVPAGLRPR